MTEPQINQQTTQQKNTIQVAVTNKLGLHARAAAQFVRLANKFACEVTLRKDGFEVNGKSILGILSLAAAKGTILKIDAKGDDAVLALAEIKELVENGFGEDV